MTFHIKKKKKKKKKTPIRGNYKLTCMNVFGTGIANI